MIFTEAFDSWKGLRILHKFVLRQAIPSEKLFSPLNLLSMGEFDFSNTKMSDLQGKIISLLSDRNHVVLNSFKNGPSMWQFMR